MKAFVTGGTGFVGSHLVSRLLQAGHDVTALVRSRAKADRIFGTKHPRYVQGDLNDAEAIAKGTRGADVVFHLAAATAARNDREFHQVNVAATERLLSATGGHFVFTSSLAALGPSAPGRPHRGAEKPNPVTPYGRSKLAAEQHVQQSGRPWTIVRPPTVYGPRDLELLRVFRMARWGVAPVFGTGAQELSFIYVEDLADALMAAAGLEPGSSWLVAHPETATTRDLVDAIGRAVRGKAPIVLPVPGIVARAALALSGATAQALGRATLLSSDKAPEFLAPAWTASAARFEAASGWRASVDLTEGLERTVAWYRRHGWL